MTDDSRDSLRAAFERFYSLSLVDYAYWASLDAWSVHYAKQLLTDFRLVDEKGRNLTGRGTRNQPLRLPDPSNVSPTHGSSMAGDVIEENQLFRERLNAAIQAKTVKVRKDQDRKRWVRPRDVIQWAVAQGHPIPREFEPLAAPEAANAQEPDQQPEQAEKAPQEPREWPNPKEATKLTAWQLKDGRLRLSTHTNGKRDGELTFKLGTKQARLLVAMLYQHPTPLLVRDALEATYRGEPYQQEIKRYIKRLRGVMYEIRKRLSDNRMNPEVFPQIPPFPQDDTRVKFNVKHIERDPTLHSVSDQALTRSIDAQNIDATHPREFRRSETDPRDPINL